MIEPLDVEVVEAHLVQVLGGNAVVDLCAEFPDHDVGSELLMSTSPGFIYEEVVDALLQVPLLILDVQIVCICMVAFKKDLFLFFLLLDNDSALVSFDVVDVLCLFSSSFVSR